MTQQTTAPTAVEIPYKVLLHLAENARWLWVSREWRDLISVLAIYVALFATIVYVLHYDVPDSVGGPLHGTVAGLLSRLGMIHHRYFGAYHSE